jgi:hypothetical protein
MSKMHTYELDDFSNGTSGSTTRLFVGDDTVVIEERTYGDYAECFSGRDDYEYSAGIDAGGAKAVLDLNGIAPGEYPTETFGRWFADNFTSDKAAVGKFMNAAEKAGVKPTVFSW